MTTAATYGVGQRPLLKRFARSINHIVTSAHGRWEDLKWLGPFTPERIPMRIRKLMRHDPQLQLGLVTLKSPFFGIEYRVEGGDPVTRRFVQQQILEHPHFPFWLWSILNALDFGFQSHEIMWGIDDVEIDPDASGPKQPISRPASYVYRRILDLDPEAVDVMVDPEFGDFLGVQYINSDAFIPASKTMQAMYRPEWQNWRGKALLDAAYWPWYFASSLYVIMNRHLELKGDPPFIGRAPSDPAYDPTVDFNDEDPEDSLQVLSLAMASLRSSSTCALPSDRDERGNLLWDINEMSLDQRGELFMEAIRHYNDLKLRSLVVPEKTVVQESSVGSFAMVNATVDVFLSNLEVIKQMLVLSTINEQLVKPLVRFNFGKSGSRRMPRVTASELSRQSKQLLSEIVKSVITMPRKALDGKEFTGAALVDLVKALKALNVPTHEVADLPEMQLPNEPPPGAGSNPPGVTTPPPNVGPPEPEPTPEELEKFSSRPKEIAAQWGVSPATVNKWAGRGCPHIRLPGRRFRFNAKLTQGWLRGLPLNQLSLELPESKVIELHLPGQHEQKDHAGGKAGASSTTSKGGNPFKGLKGEALDKKVAELLKSSDPKLVAKAKKKKASIAVQKSKAKAKAKLEADLKSDDPAVVEAAKAKIALKKKKASLAVKKSKLKKKLMKLDLDGASPEELAAEVEAKGFDPEEMLPKIGVTPPAKGPGIEKSAPEPVASAKQMSKSTALLSGNILVKDVKDGSAEGGKTMSPGAVSAKFGGGPAGQDTPFINALKAANKKKFTSGANFVSLKNDGEGLQVGILMASGKVFKAPGNQDDAATFFDAFAKGEDLSDFQVEVAESGAWSPLGAKVKQEKESVAALADILSGKSAPPSLTPESFESASDDVSGGPLTEKFFLKGEKAPEVFASDIEDAIAAGDLTSIEGGKVMGPIAVSAFMGDDTSDKEVLDMFSGNAAGFVTLKDKNGDLAVGALIKDGTLVKIPKNSFEAKSVIEEIAHAPPAVGVGKFWQVKATEDGDFITVGEAVNEEGLGVSFSGDVGAGAEAMDFAAIANAPGLGTTDIDIKSAPELFIGDKLSKTGAFTAITGKFGTESSDEELSVFNAISDYSDNEKFQGYTLVMNQQDGKIYPAVLTADDGFVSGTAVHLIPDNPKKAQALLENLNEGLVGKTDQWLIKDVKKDGSFTVSEVSTVSDFLNDAKAMTTSSPESDELWKKKTKAMFEKMNEVGSFDATESDDWLAPAGTKLSPKAADDFIQWKNPGFTKNLDEAIGESETFLVKIVDPANVEGVAIINAQGKAFKLPGNNNHGDTDAFINDLKNFGVNGGEDEPFGSFVADYEIKLQDDGKWVPVGNSAKWDSEYFKTNGKGAAPKPAAIPLPTAATPDGSLFKPIAANVAGQTYDATKPGQIVSPEALAAGWKGNATLDEITKVTNKAASAGAFEAIVKGTDDGAPWIKLKGDGGYAPATFANLEALGSAGTLDGSHKGPGPSHGFKGSSGALLAAMQKLGTVQKIDKKGATKPAWNIGKTLSTLHAPWTEEFREETRSWQDGLASGPRSLIRSFTGSHSSVVRQIQMGLKKTGQSSKGITRKNIAALEKAMDDAPKYKGKVWRGITVNKQRLGDFLSLEEHEWVGFTSTTRTEAKAFKGNIKLHIQQRTGVSVERISSVGGEDEILMRKGARFKTIKKEKIGSVWQVHLEEITAEVKSGRVKAAHELSRGGYASKAEVAPA